MKWGRPKFLLFQERKKDKRQLMTELGKSRMFMETKEMSTLKTTERVE